MYTDSFVILSTRRSFNFRKNNSIDTIFSVIDSKCLFYETLRPLALTFTYVFLILYSLLYRI